MEDDGADCAGVCAQRSERIARAKARIANGNRAKKARIANGNRATRVWNPKEYRHAPGTRSASLANRRAASFDDIKKIYIII